MRMLDRMLSKLLKHGELTVIGPGGEIRRYGAPDPELKPVTLRLMDRRTMLALLRDPTVGAVEAWMDDRLRIEQGEIIDLTRMVRRNIRWEDRSDRSGFLRHSGKLRHWFDTFNRRSSARRNVAHHYDVGNEVYRLFLDSDMQYSCAYFTDPANDLEQAQRDKKAHIAAKLRLEPGQRVLDIGCGWGGLAMYLNRVAGVEVLGITLSQEQLALARQRAEAAGVSDRVKFELIDYRDVTGEFDRIVSVGMFEHIGTSFYPSFFAKLREVLAPDGMALVHTIGRMGKPGKTDRFMHKYIFPGGYVPALSEVMKASEPERLILSDCEILRLHYMYTLLAWYERFNANRDEIVRLRGERFWKLYAFYLAGAMTMFSDGGMVVYQLQYLRDRRAAPITRDYMFDTERQLRAGDADNVVPLNQSAAG